ncbi:hypothetical protein IT403_02410 [Candidatus Nomurabacteria bacterium]|nr:hypothetical protein [Candidatus Nomurabacteria bacterium]
MEKSEKVHHQAEIDINGERKKFQQEEEFRINIIKDNLKKTGDGKDVVYEDDEED